MRKIRLIIGREIKSKLTNKTFIIMTILAPLLITGFLAFMIKMTQSELDELTYLLILSKMKENAKQLGIPL